MPPAELERLLANYTPEVRDLALRAREMILEIRPDVTEKVWPGWKVVGYGTGPSMKEMVIGVAPLKERLRIGFTEGTALPDPAGLLEGERPGHRALKVSSRAALEAPAVQTLLRAAFAGVPRAPDEPGSEGDARRAATMSDDAIRAKTGRGWDDWFALLDADGARELPHAAIAELAARHGAEPWWRQAVAVSYERARGLREKHQTPSGYQVGASKTIGAPLARLYAAWTDARTRRRWLDAKFTVRKATAEKSMRITWEDGSNVDVLFYAKGAARSQVTVDHRKLADAEAVERMRAYWRERLARLQELLEE
jgi:hypothetical protein